MSNFIFTSLIKSFCFAVWLMPFCLKANPILGPPLSSAKWIELQTASKLSPHLHTSEMDSLANKSEAPTEGQPVLIDFSPNVEAGTIRQLVWQVGAKVIERSSLGSHTLYAIATMEQILALADFKEVNYLYPASYEIIMGIPVVSCPKSFAPLGPIPKYAASSKRWGNPGDNPIALGYYFGPPTPDLPVNIQKNDLLKAMNEWAKYVNLVYTEKPNPGEEQTIDFYFGYTYPNGNHDGPGSYVAQTYYPDPGPVPGNLYFDESETWTSGIYPDAGYYSYDLYSVALHELGHALGLLHSSDPTAIMFPTVSSTVSGLRQDDINGIRSIYVPKVAPIPPYNDDFMWRAAITNIATPTVGMNSIATKEIGEPLHAQKAGGKSVWWKWKAPRTGNYLLTTAGSTFDTLLAVYTGTVLTNLTLVGADDDSGPGTSSQVSVDTIYGITYIITVDGYNGASGSISLNFVPFNPTITITEPLPFTNIVKKINRKFRIKGTAMSTDEKIKTIEFSLNNQLTWNKARFKKKVGKWFKGGLGKTNEGPTTVYVRAVDTNGNYSLPISVYFTIIRTNKI